MSKQFGHCPEQARKIFMNKKFIFCILLLPVFVFIFNLNGFCSDSKMLVFIS
ncbi:hypothetical protein GMMP1_40023 [Candidatus Magnetomoraceae bacterium gMMP-1]